METTLYITKILMCVCVCVYIYIYIYIYKYINIYIYRERERYEYKVVCYDKESVLNIGDRTCSLNLEYYKHRVNSTRWLSISHLRDHQTKGLMIIMCVYALA